MTDVPLLVVALITLLVGLAAGKAWERYKLRDGQWLDRRKLRDSPHYLQGLNFLVAQQVDLAMDELGRAAALNSDAVEVQIILGNLFREKGQVGRAIQIHQLLLQRPRLRPHEHVAILMCLGLDFKSGGFVDRAFEAFSEVLRVEPANPAALLNLEKLHEDQHQWTEARAIRQQLAAAAPADQQARHQRILAFLENELGAQALKRMDYNEAARHFAAAIDLDASVVPAYLNLGDVRFLAGQAGDAAAIWERLVDVAPDRAYLAFERLASVYPKVGREGRFAELCRRLISANPQDWRARLALARQQHESGATAEAFALLLDALSVNPHAMTVHQAVWRVLDDLHFDPDLVHRYVEVSRDAVFYHDPHLCIRCHYRSTELLWQCPHCHEWNSFVEERLTPAKEDPELSLVGNR
jgi:lipopolysaccharide assembly protein B